MTNNELVTELERAEKIIADIGVFAAIHGMHTTAHGSFNCKELFTEVKLELLRAGTVQPMEPAKTPSASAAP